MGWELPWHLSENVFLQSITQVYGKLLSSLLLQFAPQHNPMRLGYSQVTLFICLIHKYLYILIFNSCNIFAVASAL